MADTKTTIDIIFNGIDKTAGAISSVIGGVERGAKNLRDLAEPIANVTAGVLKFEAAILTSGAAMTLFAVKTAGDFDAAFREIATLIDLPLESLGEFRQGILEYAADSTQSIDQITAAVYGAISAGVKYTDSIGVVQRAEQLAVASKADLQDTLVLLVSSLNAYGKGADDAQQFSDALFTTVKQGQTTLPELASSLAQVTGLAASAEVPFETLLSAVASLTAAGLPTSQAITSIKAALSNIIKPSSEAAKEAEALGVQFNASALQTKGFEGVLQDVYRATGGNVDQMAKFFGSVEGLNAVLTLTGTGAQKFSETLDTMKNSTGATAEAFGKMADNINLGAQKVQNALKVMLVGIGTPLLDEFGGIAEAIAAIFQAVGQSVGQGNMGQFVREIEAMAQQAQATLEAVARNLPSALESADFSGFLDGLRVLRDTITSMFSGADLTSAEGLKKAIDIVGTGFMTLSTFSANAVKAIGPFIELLADLAEFVVELDPEVIQLAGSIGGVAIAAGPVLTSLTSVAGAVRSVATGIAGAGGLASALAAVAASPAGIALGLTALAAAAYKAGTDIYQLTDHAKEYRKIQMEIAEAEGIRAELTGKLADKLSEVSRETGLVIGSMDELNQLEREGIIIFDEAAGKWVKAGQAAKETTDAATSGLIDWSERLKHLTIDLEENGQSAIDAAAAYYELQGTTPELARRMAELEAPVKKAGEVMEEAQKKSESFQMKLEELASNERIRNLELRYNLKVSEIENETRRISEAFGSVNQTVTDTGDLIGSLVGSLANLDGSLSASQTRDIIVDQLERENRAREQALELQKQLTEAQIKAINEKTRRLRSGDALLKVQADGLEPALEMILWQVLEKIQIRASEEASEFLLGI